ISEVKQNMIANHMFVGGKRTRGFTQQRIGGRQYLVADWKEKQLLMLLASFKKQRDKVRAQLQKKRLNTLGTTEWSYLGIQTRCGGQKSNLTQQEMLGLEKMKK
ncbi:MAG: hypothetical protein ACKOAO_03735, partial [Oxalobacteraceae bacterium]